MRKKKRETFRNLFVQSEKKKLEPSKVSYHHFINKMIPGASSLNVFTRPYT